MITLKLSYPAYDPDLDIPERADPKNIGYEIEQVTNSSDYVPGQFLTKVRVRELCEMSGMFTIHINKRKD